MCFWNMNFSVKRVTLSLPLYKPGSVCVCVLSHVRLFATRWTVACQAPLSMELLEDNKCIPIKIIA